MSALARRGSEYRRLVDLSETLLAGFEQAGYERIDPPMLHDAAHVGLGGQTLLDLTYLMGNGLALRSDFTVPVYLLHAERGRDAGTPRYCYSGPVFRRSGPGDDRPTEYMQLGIEYFGSLRREAADVRIFANILSALHRSGLSDVPVMTGDVGLFHAVLDTLDISERNRTRLRGLFWRPEQLRAQIERMQSPVPLPADLTGPDIEAQLRDRHVIQGKRTPAEVAEMLRARATDTLSAEAANTLQVYLDIACPIGEVPERMRAVLGTRLDGALTRFEDRLRELRHRLGPETATLPFRADFGRRHEYYDGFVFEMTHADQIVAAGGRYDRLAQKVSDADWPAIGGMIRPQILLSALDEVAP